MKKFATSMFVAAALCMPSAALADHALSDPTLLGETVESEDACEDALAEDRNMQRMSGEYEGRERGDFNKRFNARYDCEETRNGKFMIEDNEA